MRREINWEEFAFSFAPIIVCICFPIGGVVGGVSIVADCPGSTIFGSSLIAFFGSLLVAVALHAWKGLK